MRPLPFLLFLTACDPSGAALSDALCTRLAASPTASATGSAPGQGPDLFATDTTVELTLNDDGSGGFSGYFTLTPDSAGSYALGFESVPTVTVYDGAGDEVRAEDSVEDACDEMAVRHTWAMGAERHIVEIHATSATLVFAIEPAESQ